MATKKPAAPKRVRVRKPVVKVVVDSPVQEPVVANVTPHEPHVWESEQRKLERRTQDPILQG